MLRVPGLELPVCVRGFASPKDGFCVVYPRDRVNADQWTLWLATCKRVAAFDPTHKYWVWSRLLFDRYTTELDAVKPKSLTEDDRLKIREARKLAEEQFLKGLEELSKNENVPEHLWNSYSYPSHLIPKDPAPTALQRIIVSRYWNKPYALIGASVGTGKTRMTVDMLSARALTADPALNDSVRIILVTAPLVLHTNWEREFRKWAPEGVTWLCHKFSPSKEFWSDVEKSADFLWEQGKLRAGGIVIICTPQSISRRRLIEQFAAHNCTPTAIVIDEIQKFFRNPSNSAFKNCVGLRKSAHFFLGLSGTPTSKFQDWWALQELMSNSASEVHWKNGSYEDYVRLGDPETMAYSGLWEKGWTFERAVKEFHADRIKKGHVFMADKHYYMKDALPGLDQEELGDFADTRVSFHSMFNDYEEWVEAAWELQKSQNPDDLKGAENVIAQVLLLRMRQLAAMSQDNQDLLEQFVNEFLEPEEPCVFWVEFRSEPCCQLEKVVNYLKTIGPTAFICGGMKECDRQEAIDGFQAGKYRFFVCQTEAGGVGLTLTRAHKCLFLTIPFGYLAIAQAIGRLHRIGQEEDVTSYFAMTSPVASFARGIYDRRAELNEIIPQKISGVIRQQSVDKVAPPPKD